MPYRLIAVKGPLAGRTFVVVKTETKIGREPGNDLVLNDDFVSRLHATITTRGDQHTIINGSPNGTLVNGKRVEKATLKNGDEITLGAVTVLRYESMTAEPVRREAAPGRPREEERAEAVTPLPGAGPGGAVPFWRRRPKLVIGGAIYLAAILALGIYLWHRQQVDRGRQRHLAQITIPTEQEIQDDLLSPVRREPDPLEAQRRLQRAIDLFEQRYVDPANLFAAIIAFKEARAYGAQLNRHEYDSYVAAIDQLKAAIVKLYYDARTLQNSGRYEEARKRYELIRGYVNDPDSLTFQNAKEHIAALTPLIEKPRWSPGR